MNRLLLVAALVALPSAALAGCNSWDYTPWECGYVRDLQNRQADLENSQRRFETEQRQRDAPGGGYYDHTGSYRY
jgi:outer membrane murein-binding lipoprotein Lpp